jgi:hypothetical protein
MRKVYITYTHIHAQGALSSVKFVQTTIEGKHSGEREGGMLTSR